MRKIANAELYFNFIAEKSECNDFEMQLKYLPKVEGGKVKSTKEEKVLREYKDCACKWSCNKIFILQKKNSNNKFHNRFENGK